MRLNFHTTVAAHGIDDPRDQLPLLTRPVHAKEAGARYSEVTGIQCERFLRLDFAQRIPGVAPKRRIFAERTEGWAVDRSARCVHEPTRSASARPFRRLDCGDDVHTPQVGAMFWHVAIARRLRQIHDG